MEEQKIGVGLEFCGVRYRAVESGEYLDQDVYVHNKLENLNTGKLRGRNPDDELDSELPAVYGTTIGRRIWVLPTQLRYSYEVSYRSRYRAFPRTKQLRRLANVVKFFFFI